MSLGCPSGIGPEVAVAASVAIRQKARIVLVGDERIVRRALRGRKGVVVREVDSATELARGEIGVLRSSAKLDPVDAPFGAPTKRAGRAQYAWFEEAMTLVERGAASAIVTGPVSKATVQAAGVRGFLGHTEALAERFGVREVTMAFVAEAFTTALVTTHLPLAKVAAAVTERRVARAIEHLSLFLRRRNGKRPTILVAGLNPHAGESGKIGHEEKRISRAILRTAKFGAIEGPMGAETVFRRASNGGVDGVVAMYHDQATIPMKLLSFGDAVNITLGLPILRTSVDHGTGYDIAGTGKADARGMLKAMLLATELASVEVKHR